MKPTTFATAIPVAAAILFASGISADAQTSSAAPASPLAKWAPWFEFGGHGGSDGSSRGEAALWVPLAQDGASLIFMDVRGKLFEEGADEINVAFGYRHMLASGWNVGVWAGYDRRHTAAGSTFGQVAGGFELISADYDIRFNGYLPTDDEKTLFDTSSTFTTGVRSVEIVGDEILLVTPGIVTTATARELALSGVDGEVGARLFGGYGTGLPELRVYAGGFYFDHSDLAEAIAGPRARMELRFDDIIPAAPGSRLTLEGEFSHDEVRDNRWEIGARLRIPFGAAATQVASLSPQERRMTEGLERDTDIVTQTAATSTVTTDYLDPEHVEDELTGTAFDRVEIVEAGKSLGDASASAGANALIIVRGDPAAGAQTIQGNQTILGSGTAIEVRGTTSGTVATFTDAGARPTQVSGTNGLLLGGDNIHVAGMNVQADLTYGVQATGRSNVILNQLGISGAGGLTDGVQISGNNGDVRIFDTVIENTGDDGIQVSGTNNQVTVSGSTIRNVGFGIYTIAGSGSLSVTFTDTEFTGIESDGLLLRGTGNRFALSGVTFSDIGDDAIDAANTLNLTMDDSVLDGSIGGFGIRANDDVDITGGGNTMTGASFGLGFCFGAWTGTIEFDGTDYTSADC